MSANKTGKERKMEIAPFQLEEYFAKYEFSARYLLSSSDCEALSLAELLAMADAETANLWEQLKLGYTDTWGHPLMREEIAGIYEGIDESEVLAVVPEEGIFLCMHALLEPQDHVICTFPGYQSLYEVARSIGCEVTTWLPDEANDWHFDIKELARNLRPNTKVVIINFPHNPTGHIPSSQEYRDILRLVHEHGAYLFSDEMYQFLEAVDGVTLPAASGLYERAISFSGLSKTYGLPGLRIGWLASKDRMVLNKISQLKSYTTICGSAPAEILAIIALRSKSRIIQQQNERVRKNLQVLDRFFTDFKDLFKWNRPKGGSICFPRMLKVDDTFAFCEEMVNNAGIMLVPSRVFQFGDHHVRVGFGRENFPEVIQLFARHLEQRLR
jgi:aspartate/methionine/tyrosine aminotransferase